MVYIILEETMIIYYTHHFYGGKCSLEQYTAPIYGFAYTTYKFLLTQLFLKSGLSNKFFRILVSYIVRLLAASYGCFFVIFFYIYVFTFFVSKYASNKPWNKPTPWPKGKHFFCKKYDVGSRQCFHNKVYLDEPIGF